VEKRRCRLTWILSILWTNIIIASIKNILIHQRRSRRHLPEKANLDRLPNLHLLALLHEYLPRILAPVLAIQGRHPVLLRVVALFERLERGHEVVPARDAVGDDALGDAGRHGALDDGGDRVHGADDFGLELWGNVEFDLLEEVFGGAEAANDKDVLCGFVLAGIVGSRMYWVPHTWSARFCAWMAII